MLTPGRRTTGKLLIVLQALFFLQKQFQAIQSPRCHKFRADGSFEGWVRRIFINCAIELLRERRQHIPVELLAETYLPVADDSPLSSLYNKDLLKTTQLLSDGYRTVFELYAIEGLTHKQIAERLGISEGTSKSQYCRAKAILRSSLTRTSREELKVVSAA